MNCKPNPLRQYFRNVFHNVIDNFIDIGFFDKSSLIHAIFHTPGT